MRSVCRFFVCLILISMVAFSRSADAQSDRGTITGTITDRSGAVVASVDVIATQAGTGVRFKTKSQDLGFYSLLELPVGDYSISFTKTGFKNLQRSGVIVEAQHTVAVNAALQVGSVAEVVTVTTATPVLELQTEVGTNMGAIAMTDLPLSASGGRDITSFAFAITPNVGGSEWQTNIAGSQAFSKSVLIDGTSADSGVVGHIQESEPSMDAIQESQVDTTGLRAEDGRSGGGAFLYEMKSGTDKFHGATFGFLGNEFLNANTWDNNWYLSQCAPGDTTCIDKYRRAQNRYFDYGFSGGGPIWKKRKMYIFAAYEKYMQADWVELPNQMTVPTTDMLNGNFSELLATGALAHGCSASPCPIMNGTTPYTDSAGNTIYYGSIFSPKGTVYPGNIITDPISPISQKIVSIYQQYYKPQGAGDTLNFPTIANAEPWFHQTQLSFKYDWALRDSDHIAVSYIYTLRPRTCPASGCGSVTSLWTPNTTTGGPLANAVQQTVISNEYRINEVHTFSPTVLNTLAYTFNAFQNKELPTTQLASSTNWANELGFGQATPLKEFPQIAFNGSPNGVGETSIGTQTNAGGYVAYNAMLNESLSWTKGRHNLKFGTEIRYLGFNEDTGGGALKMQFSNNTFAPTNTQIQPFVGSAFANFLLGQVQSADQNTTLIIDSRRKELAFFAQDDIRVNKRLSLSADIRWELTRPLHVMGGDWTNFDPIATSRAFVSLNGQGIPGAITWLQHPGDTFETYTDWHQFAPKFGAAYQISNKIVARASYGINYVPLGWNSYNATPYGSAVGYQATSRVVEVAAQTPAYQWDGNPYPGVITPASGPAPTSTYLPWEPTSVDPHTRQLGLTENWFAGIQYQLPGNANLEVSYMGNTGRNLHDGALVPTNFPTWAIEQKLLLNNNCGRCYNWVYDAASASAAGVPYPYSGFAGEAYFATNPYPQVQAAYDGGVAFTNTPIGQSGYNAVTIEVKKQRGALNLDMSYNWSRATGNAGSAFIDTYSISNGFQDPYNYRHDATAWPYTNDSVKGFLSYDLPFGHGRKFLAGSRALDVVVGGWKAGAIVAYSNGGNMGWIGSSNSYPGWSAVYANVTPGASFKNQFVSWNPGFNSVPNKNALFFNPANFTNPTYGQLGNAEGVIPNWRGWAAPSENASLLKKTHFGSDGRYVMTLRAEFFNLFNRHYWSGPNTNIASPFFGQVMGVSGNRTGQLGARFEW